MKPHNNVHGGRNSVTEKICWLLKNLSKRKYSQIEIRNELHFSQRSLHRYMETMSIHFCVCSRANSKKAEDIYYWLERGTGRKEIWED